MKELAMLSVNLRNAAYFTLVAWLLLDGLLVFTKYSRGAKSADRGSLWWVISVLWLGIALAMYRAYTPGLGSLGAATVPVQLFGFAVMALGIGIRFIAVRQLGKLHMPVVAIQADHPLMDRGLYAKVRHPSYLGATLALFGFGLGLGNGVSALVALVAALVSYGYRIHVEEIALVKGLGDRYIDYRLRTRRLIPWIY
ncbi:MAG TPA: isoprenylcysteine carboxylmethyltransferase family protein [Gammaproteobacteria bacterium]|jgi:protein-S-isoprenylcysteine O-methyltransferase